ncbi:hypothetical protein D3C72_1012680 [compost metagenome]
MRIGHALGQQHQADGDAGHGFAPQQLQGGAGPGEERKKSVEQRREHGALSPYGGQACRKPWIYATGVHGFRDAAGCCASLAEATHMKKSWTNV